MMSRKNGVGQIIKACVTGGTLIALTGQFRVIKAALDDLFGLTRWTLDAVWPAQFAYGLITLHIIDQILDIDLHRWTPVRVREMGCHQFTTFSNSTTLESNMSLASMTGRAAPSSIIAPRSARTAAFGKPPYGIYGNSPLGSASRCRPTMTTRNPRRLP